MNGPTDFQGRLREARKARFESNARPVVISDGVLLDENGVAPIINPRNTGGRAQYGFTEEP
jgi:hypothetical protein